MMRSMAESMASSVAVMSVQTVGGSKAVRALRGFELRDRLVGKPELIVFAAVKHLHDNFQQAVVGDECIGNGAGLAQVIRRDRIGVADRLDIHDPQAPLDQHNFYPPIRTDKAREGCKVPAHETFMYRQEKTHRSGTWTDAPMKAIWRWLPVFFDAGLAESLVGHDPIRKPVPTSRDHAVRADTGSGRSRTAPAG